MSCERFPLLPADPSELAAIRLGSVMATPKFAAASVVDASGVKKFWPAFPDASNPAWCWVLKLVVNWLARVFSCVRQLRNHLIANLQRASELSALNLTGDVLALSAVDVLPGRCCSRSVCSAKL